MARTKRRFAAISCTHAPFENTTAINQLCNELADPPYGPITDMVMLGDLFESTAASLHPDEHKHTLRDEYESGSAILTKIRNSLPKRCNLHWILGNHDDNLQQSDSRRTDWRTRELIHWNKSEWGKEFMKWTQYPYIKPSVHNQKGCLQIGQVILMHGFDAGGNSDEIESLQAAYACGGHAWRLVIRGHTHRPRSVTQCKRSGTCLLPYFYGNAGTCGPLIPAYMARKDVTQWLPGCVWGECLLDTASRFAAKEWTAHTQILEAE